MIARSLTAALALQAEPERFDAGINLFECQKIGREPMDIEYLQKYQECDEYLRSTDLNDVEQDCTMDFCTTRLAENFVQRYHVNVPEGMGLESCNSTVNCTITMEVLYDGEAWIGVGFSENGEMIGSDAVIGIPGQTTPQKYSLGEKDVSQVQPSPENQQTLTDASIELVDGKTVMKFTKQMQEEGEVQINTGNNNFLWAYGASPTLGYHKASGSYVVNLTTGMSVETTSPYKNKWETHGFLGFLAYGVFVPFAVQAALMRGSLKKEGLWFQLHRAFNIIAYILSVTAFSMAVYYISKEGAPHFNGVHQRMGLAIVMLASIQVLGGIWRPKRPNTPNPEEPKRAARITWEVGHRALGLTLVCCGFFQMSSGVLLICEKFSLESYKTRIVFYWMWVTLMCIFTVIAAYKRWNKRSRLPYSRSWLNAVDTSHESLTENLL